MFFSTKITPSIAPFSERVEQLQRLVREADYVLIGAGAGLTTRSHIKQVLSILSPSPKTSIVSFHNFFVAFNKFVVADEAIDGDEECANKIKNEVLHGVTQGGMTA